MGRQIYCVTGRRVAEGRPAAGSVAEAEEAAAAWGTAGLSGAAVDAANGAVAAAAIRWEGVGRQNEEEGSIVMHWGAWSKQLPPRTCHLDSLRPSDRH